MYYNQRNAFYEHRECRKIASRNNGKTKKQLDKSAPKRYSHPEIGKCCICKGFDKVLAQSN